MTARIPMMLTLAALIGFASPALAAETHAAKHDPQAATTTAKGHGQKAPAAKEKAAVKGRTAKASKSKKGSAKATSAKTAPAAAPAAPPATK